MTWISVKNWGTFQHYKDRKPPWIKLYEELLDDVDLQNLSHTAQATYFRLLLVACRRDNQIPHNIAWLAEEMGMSRSAVTSGLHALVASGHAIPHASKPASGLASNAASPRARTHSQETETETEKNLADSASKNGAATTPEHHFHVPRSGHPDGDWSCPLDSFHFATKNDLLEHLDTVHWNTDPGRAAIAQLASPTEDDLDDIPF